MGPSRITSPKAINEGKQQRVKRNLELLEVMVRMVLAIFPFNVVAECRSGKEASLYNIGECFKQVCAA